MEMGEAHGLYQPMPTMFYLYVEDCDALYKRAISCRRDLHLRAAGSSLRRPQRRRNRSFRQQVVHRHPRQRHVGASALVRDLQRPRRGGRPRPPGGAQLAILSAGKKGCPPSPFRSLERQGGISHDPGSIRGMRFYSSSCARPHSRGRCPTWFVVAAVWRTRLWLLSGSKSNVGASVPLLRNHSWRCRTSGTLAPTQDSRLD